MARAAEESGFDSIWVGDHLLYRDDAGQDRGPWEAWSLLAALAAVTTRVRLGPLVACAGFHPPAMLAKKAATLDEIAGGRLVLGLGAGWNEAESRAFGLPFEHRVSRFEESFHILRRLLGGERVTSEGRFFQVHDAVLHPAPLRRPPMMVGSTGERMLAITVAHVQAWNTWFEHHANTPEGFAEASATVSAAARAAGRDPGEIERSACVFVRLGEGAGERGRTSEVRPLHGAPEAIAAGLGEFADAGAHEAILVVDPITEDSIRTLAGVLELLDA